MRIAIWHNLPSGGGKRALYGQVAGLLDRGHEVEAWCPPRTDSDYLPLSDLITEHEVPLEAPVLPGWKRNLVEIANDIRIDIAAMDRHCGHCVREMTSGSFDILFANSCTQYRTTAIGRLSPLRSVLYLQEPYRWLYEAVPDFVWAADQRPQGWWHRPRPLAEAARASVRMRRMGIQVREEIRNARGFDSILVNSLFSRESLLRSYGIGAKVCRLGVDTKLFVAQRHERGRFLVTVGAFVREKNAEFLIDSLSRCRAPRLPLVWVANICSDTELRRMTDKAEALGVDLDVRVRVSDQELVALLNDALAMVYAPRLEPLGFAPLEAAACGLPVVAVAEGGVRETVVDGVTGLLVEGSPDSFAAAVDRLATDQELAMALGEGASRHVEECWSMAESLDQLEAALARHEGTLDR